MRGWLVGIGLGVVGVSVIVVGLVWSRVGINFPPLIQLRKYYYTVMLPRVSPKSLLSYDRLPYELIAVESKKVEDVTFYTYLVLGKFKNVDLAGRTITLIGRSGREYPFELGFNTEGVFEYFVVRDPRNEIVDIERYLVGDEGVVDFPLQEGDVMGVYWLDSRKINKILEDSDINPGGLVNYGENVGTVSVTRFYDK